MKQQKYLISPILYCIFIYIFLITTYLLFPNIIQKYSPQKELKYTAFVIESFCYWGYCEFRFDELDESIFRERDKKHICIKNERSGITDYSHSQELIFVVPSDFYHGMPGYFIFEISPKTGTCIDMVQISYSDKNVTYASPWLVLREPIQPIKTSKKMFLSIEPYGNYRINIYHSTIFPEIENNRVVLGAKLITLKTHGKSSIDITQGFYYGGASRYNAQRFLYKSKELAEWLKSRILSTTEINESLFLNSESLSKKLSEEKKKGYRIKVCIKKCEHITPFTALRKGLERQCTYECVGEYNGTGSKYCTRLSETKQETVEVCVYTSKTGFEPDYEITEECWPFHGECTKEYYEEWHPEKYGYTIISTHIVASELCCFLMIRNKYNIDGMIKHKAKEILCNLYPVTCNKELGKDFFIDYYKVKEVNDSIIYGISTDAYALYKLPPKIIELEVSGDPPSIRVIDIRKYANYNER